MNPKNLFITAASVVGLGGLLTLLAMAMTFWIQQEVSAQLADAGIVPASHVASIETAVGQNAKDIERVDSKAERIAQILMEPD